MSGTNSFEGTDFNLSELVLEKINFGEELIQSTEKLSTLDGLQKLQRKIRQELRFLKKILKTGNIKREYLQCSNLTHFSAIIDHLSTVKDCICINKSYVLDNRKVTIDIVCDNGVSWRKVIARNPKSLSQICMGDASYGVRSVLDQAQDYLQCAQMHPCLFQIPQVVFVFANGVGINLASELESKGIIVQGQRLSEIDIGKNDDLNRDTFPCVERNDSLTSENSITGITKVNLDVSAMLAYVSSVTNGSAGVYKFSVHVLAQQAKWEQQRPQKPILEKFFRGKQLYCCQTAKDNFVNIVNTVGGPNEKLRADDFLKTITVLPDDAKAENCSRFSQIRSEECLKLGGKIKKRSLIIFTFGDRIGAVTVTANDGFIRSAKQQGIHFVVFLHESRALTEQKEQTKAVGFTNSQI